MAAHTILLEQAAVQPAHPTVPKPRLFYIDNLRTVLITCVVLGHLSVTYGLDADWIYYEAGEVNPVVNIIELFLMGIGVGFALGLFFMIAGYFTPAAYDRKGPGRFLLDRLKRLGIPWLIYEIFINPLIHYAVDVHGGDCQGALYDCQYQGTFWQYLTEFPRVSASFGDGPVWFLEALLIFSLLYAGWRVLTRTAQPVPGEPNSTASVPSNRAIILFALFIGLSTFVVRFWAKAFVQYEPFHLEFARFPQYLALFAAGIWAYRRGWLTSFSDRQATSWRWVAVGCVLALPVLLAAFGALTGEIDERAMRGANWMSLAYSVWEGFLSVSMAIAVLAWFRLRFNHQGRLGQAMSRAAFTVYVIHPGIIVPLALALSGISMNLSLKFLLVAPVGIALSYLTAYALSRVPVARTIFA